MVEKHLITKYVDFMDKNTERNIDKNRVRCTLCPNMCVIIDGFAGLCKTRVNIKGKLYSTVYGYPCSIHIDPVEKKPLYHYYPGEGILSLGTFGCNLFCKGCQNFDISRADASKNIKYTLVTDTTDKNTNLKNALKYYTPKEIVDIALKSNIKLIAYTYNEPTVFFEYMLDIAKLAKKKGIKNVLVSNGYINPEPLKELCKYIDAANIDIKGITEKFYRQYSKVDIKPILKTIKTLHKSNVWIELTNLIIPELNDSSEDITKLCKWIKENVGANVPLHFSRFYPYYQASSISQTSQSKLEEAKKIALKTGIKYVYIGNLGFLEDTYCPKCKKLVISRSYDSINRGGLDGKSFNKCKNCKTIISGIFK